MTDNPTMSRYTSGRRLAQESEPARTPRRRLKAKNAASYFNLTRPDTLPRTLTTTLTDMARTSMERSTVRTFGQALDQLGRDLIEAKEHRAWTPDMVAPFQALQTAHKVTILRVGDVTFASRDTAFVRAFLAKLEAPTPCVCWTTSVGDAASWDELMDAPAPDSPTSANVLVYDTFTHTSTTSTALAHYAHTAKADVFTTRTGLWDLADVRVSQPDGFVRYITQVVATYLDGHENVPAVEVIDWLLDHLEALRDGNVSVELDQFLLSPTAGMPCVVLVYADDSWELAMDDNVARDLINNPDSPLVLAYRTTVREDAADWASARPSSVVTYPALDGADDVQVLYLNR